MCENEILHSELILIFFQTSRIFRAGPNVGPRGPGFIFKNTNFILPFFKKKYLNYNYFNANFNFLRFVFWKWSPILYIQCKSLETGEYLSMSIRTLFVNLKFYTANCFNKISLWDKFNFQDGPHLGPRDACETFLEWLLYEQ